MKQKNFSKLPKFKEVEVLANLQKESFDRFLQPDKSREEREDIGLEAIFREMFPVDDPHTNFRIEYLGYEIGEEKMAPRRSMERGATYSRPINGYFRLIRYSDQKREKIEDVVEQKVYLLDMPFLTPEGSFIINGVERAVISQIQRSPGIYIPLKQDIYTVLIVPSRGSWFQIDLTTKNLLFAVLERTKKIPFFTFLRAIGVDIEKTFKKFVKVKKRKPEIGDIIGGEIRTPEGTLLADIGDKVSEELVDFLKEKGMGTIPIVGEDSLRAEIFINSYRNDKSLSRDEAYRFIYRKLRGSIPSVIEMAEELINRLLFDEKRFYLGEVGRYKINKKLHTKRKNMGLTREDIIDSVDYLIKAVEGEILPDDLDSLINRRVKRIGEQLDPVIRNSLSQLIINAKERASYIDDSKMLPIELLNSPVMSNSITKFFTTGAVSQFMDQVNPLASLTHRRRITALGPGGLTKDTAGFEVRDVHYTHYGKVCPVEVPEGQNIGLISSLTYYSRIDKFGFLTTPYVKVENGKITDKIEYLSSEQEEKFVIAQIDVTKIEDGKIVNKDVVARRKGEFITVSPKEVDYIDYSPKQVFSPSATLIPFLEHDDGDRALMGSNMQRQAVPLLFPEPPLVATGVEAEVAKNSGAVLISEYAGEVQYVDARRIVLSLKQGFKEYKLFTFRKSNQYTSIHFRPAVKVGQKVKKGDVIAEGYSTKDGMLSLGKNILVAFMPFWGYNYEDAIVVSDRLLRDDTFTSIHILEFSVEVRETKLGPQEITRDIPGVSESELVNLDKFGIIRIGAEVIPDDILVGRVTPRGETELTPEERLLKAIFSDKSSNVRDTSLRVEPGVKGVVIARRVLTRSTKDNLAREVIKQRMEEVENEYRFKMRFVEERIKKDLSKVLIGKTLNHDIYDTTGRLIFKKAEAITIERIEALRLSKIDITDIKVKGIEEELGKIKDLYHKEVEKLEDERVSKLKFAQNGDELPHGVLKIVKIYVAQKRKLSVGDKFSGRHGNKGVVSKILPQEDMPYLPDGTPVDMVLNTLGVPSRMNIGQILEVALGLAASKLGYQAVCHIFDSPSIQEVKTELKKSGFPESGKIRLKNGRTGKFFEQEATVGVMYMMKLVHMVYDKLHARSTGKYSLITQQPLGGKSQFGGQRLGEMEVWALEAYGAAYTLQEMLTIKSDAVDGRNKLYEALIKGEMPPIPKMPTSFNVLLNELRGLGLNLRPYYNKKKGEIDAD